MSDRIYPVSVKPASRIASWNGWPEDVRSIIFDWNRGNSRTARLTFVRGGVFKCWGCGRFCESHTNGRAVLDGDDYCDDCLVDAARGWRFVGHEGAG